jgi:hypothetical protein
VSIGQGADESNRLAIGGDFTVLGAAVRLRGKRVGTVVSNGAGKADLEVTFTSEATAAIVERLVRAVTFRTVSASTTLARAIEFEVLDSLGEVLVRRTRLVRIA